MSTPDESRAKLVQALEQTWDGDTYDDIGDGLLESIALGMLYIGDAIRERGVQ